MARPSLLQNAPNSLTQRRNFENQVPALHTGNHGLHGDECLAAAAATQFAAWTILHPAAVSGARYPGSSRSKQEEELCFF